MLTQRQRQVLDFIKESIDNRGYPPTFREIGERMGIKSTNGVNDHLKALEKKGFLQRDDLKSRALRPLQMFNEPSQASVLPSNEPLDTAVMVPVLGKCAAGIPILAVEQVEELIKVDRFFLGPHREVFALRVYGESMIGAGIFHGDYVFVRRQCTAELGDMVVVLLNADEATVKYFHPEKKRVLFKSANPSFEPIVINKDDIRAMNILGIVVGVYRRVV